MTFEQFHSLSGSGQAHLIVSFAHNLTIVAREAYAVGSDEVAIPKLLRHLNELQHRLMGFVRSLLDSEPSRCPDDEVVFATLTKPPY